MKEKELPKPAAQERLGKAYEASAHEDQIYKMWEESGKFNPDNYDLDENSGYFSIVLPPPNVTGVLHLGHSMTVAIEDLMVRYNRMLGKRTLFLPGTDHAAIATQAKVEQLMLKEEGIKRHDLSRQEFFDRIQKFAKESRKTILHQVRKLGASCDWSRERYTLDDDVSLAVKEVFIRMYRDGLIYRGDRVINWCPNCQSTLSDDEVNHKTGNAKFYTFKYSADFPIAISTTRPETKLADTAVAVHPSDERYKEFVGKTYDINFAGVPLKIKVIADFRVDKDFGTGALGVTPAHSMTDYQLALEHELPIIKLINPDGKINENGGEYEGKTVLEARKGVAKWIKENDLLIEEKDISQNLSICYRCDNPIEPMPMLQWFIGVNKEFKIKDSKIEGIKDGATVTLKTLMRQVATNSQIEFIPERFKDIYLQWIDNLNDWCISRQVIFGHRIPVWYKDSEVFVGMEAPAEKGWKEESDTLDTWFSSGMWPFSTMGWPMNVMQDTVAERYEEKNDLERFFPTSVLETGYDILFFWVARMILMSTYTLGDVPFKKVYLHGMVLDEKGQKMSKSKGNAIDPLDLIPKFGADAIRLSMVIGMTPGNNMRLYDQKVEGARNLVNKLYNIARYIIQETKKSKNQKNKRPKTKTLADEWILNELDKTIYSVTKKIEESDFSLAGEELRKFTWDTLADWYLEIAKVEGKKDEILNYLLEKVLILWHPFAPFVTEYLWSEAGYGEMLMTQRWPVVIPEDIKKVDFDLTQQAISTIRNMRSENKIEPALKLNCILVSQYNKELEAQAEIIKKLCRLESLEIVDTLKIRPKQSAAGVFGEGNMAYLLLANIIDIDKEKARLEKEIDKTLKEVTMLSGKLDQEQFVKNAPQEIVEAEKARFAQAQDTLNKLRNQLTSLV